MLTIIYTEVARMSPFSCTLTAVRKVFFYCTTQMVPISHKRTCFFLSPLLLVASRAGYSTGNWCLSGCRQTFFQIATSPTVFLQNWAHMIYAPIRTKRWNRFLKFCCKIFGEFLPKLGTRHLYAKTKINLWTNFPNSDFKSLAIFLLNFTFNNNNNNDGFV